MTTPRVQQLYEMMPPPLQEVALAIFGLRNRRRLRAWQRELARLRASEYWEPDESVAYVAGRLREVLGHAMRHVPRYRSFAAHIRDLDASDADVVRLLEIFPPVTRAEIKAEPDAFLSNAVDRRKLATTITSGTTGTPFTTWMPREVKLLSDALWWRRTAWAGWQEGDWIARLVGDPVISLRERNPRRPVRRSWTDRRLYLSSYHLSEDSAPRIANYLREFRPAFLMGYPSALDALVRLAGGERGFRCWKPKAVLFSSEPLYAHQREAISGALQAPIRGLYGCAERVVSAAECEHGTYHLSVIDGFIEGMFGLLRACQPARITGLLNPVMPLIRYELGDTLTQLPSLSCQCGRTLPAIDAIMTKAEDVVITPSGRYISSSVITWAFKQLDGLQRSQLIQKDSSQIQVILQATASSYPALVRTLRPRLEELFFGEMQLDFRRTDELAVGLSGKTRFVISEWRPAEPGRKGAKDS